MKSKIINPALLLITAILVTPKITEALIIPNNLPRLEIAQTLRDRPDFFGEGREQFEEEIQRLEKKRPDSILTIETADLKWQNFIFREGGFTIWMPQGTITEETEVVETAFGKLEFKVFATHPPDARFAIAYSENLPPEELENPQEILAKVSDRLIKVEGFELISDRSFNLKDYPGRELVLQSLEEKISFRIYLANRRLYVLGASQPISAELSRSVLAFFDSFELE